MHLGQPRACVECPNALPIDHERKQDQIVGKEHTTEDSGDDGGVSTFQDPVEQVYAKCKADELLAHAHSDQHF